MILTPDGFGDLVRHFQYLFSHFQYLVGHFQYSVYGLLNVNCSSTSNYDYVSDSHRRCCYFAYVEIVLKVLACKILCLN